MFPYSMIFAKLGLGLLALILQINLLGQAQSGTDVGFGSDTELRSRRHYRRRHL